MTFHEYSSAYFPVAPVCQIYLGEGGGQPTLGPFEALIDTGSDMTVIPTDYLHQARAKRISRGQARSMWGDSRTVDIYVVSLGLDDLRITTLQVLADDQGNEIVLGRLVLNRLRIILDGPASLTEITDNI